MHWQAWLGDKRGGVQVMQLSPDAPADGPLVQALVEHVVQAKHKDGTYGQPAPGAAH